MKYITITLVVVFTVGSLNTQKRGQTLLTSLIKTWGEVSDRSPVHAGKSDLILLKLKNDKPFSAYMNTDYGASILQTGRWKIKNNNIVFKVIKTVQGREGKEYFMQGKLLSSGNGEIKYKIITSGNNNLCLEMIKPIPPLYLRKPTSSTFRSNDFINAGESHPLSYHHNPHRG